MRHIILIGAVTLLMAMLTALAWQHDHARQADHQSSVEHQIDSDMQRLEQQYLSGARSLLALRGGNDGLIADIDNAQAELGTITSPRERDQQFQALVARIRTRLLNAPNDNEATLQEWRRIQDQLNGSLHRRTQLQERLQAAP